MIDRFEKNLSLTRFWQGSKSRRKQSIDWQCSVLFWLSLTETFSQTDMSLLAVSLIVFFNNIFVNVTCIHCIQIFNICQIFKCQFWFAHDKTRFLQKKLLKSCGGCRKLLPFASYLTDGCLGVTYKSSPTCVSLCKHSKVMFSLHYFMLFFSLLFCLITQNKPIHFF